MSVVALAFSDHASPPPHRGRRVPAGRGFPVLPDSVVLAERWAMIPPVDEQGEVAIEAAALRRWAEAARAGDAFVYATCARLTGQHAAREALRLQRAGLVLLTQAAIPGRVERAYRATRSSAPWPGPRVRATEGETAPAEVLDDVFDTLVRAARFARPCPTDAQLAERAGCARAVAAAAIAELAETGAITVEGVRAPTLRRVTVTALGLSTGAVRR